MNQQLSDGSWESSDSVGFQTRQCAGNPVISASPTVLGFALNFTTDLAKTTQPGGTLLRDCGEAILTAYLSFPASLGFAVVRYEFYVGGVKQTNLTTDQTSARVPVIILRLGAVPTRTNDAPMVATIKFPNALPPSEASIYLRCR